MRRCTNSGKIAHQAASFLPWHRHFLSIFSHTLRSTCNFTDQLPYLDWTLDYASPATSPIFDPEHGFGGDGNVTGTFILNDGRCIVDGPFVDMRPLWDNYTANPHCISRGFKDVVTGEVGSLSGYAFRPDAMEEIMSQRSFKSFSDMLEKSLHDALHNGINGGFGSLTSANGISPIKFHFKNRREDILIREM